MGKPTKSARDQIIIAPTVHTNPTHYTSHKLTVEYCKYNCGYLYDSSVMTFKKSKAHILIGVAPFLSKNPLNTHDFM